MKRSPAPYFLLLLSCVYSILHLEEGHAQTVVVTGTVSTTADVVRYASVYFEEQNNPANTAMGLTDSTGRYQVSLTVTAVDAKATLPTAFALEQNYPNPFSASTAISYQLKAQAETRVTIYDILGRVVRESRLGAQPAGTHGILWDGSNDLGERVAPGVYFYTLRAGGEDQTKKMVFKGGTEGTAVLSLGVMLPAAADVPDPLGRSLGRTFSVRIENADSTSPLILNVQFDNLEVLGDTTLDFTVDRHVPLPVSAIDPDSVRQYIRGFGGANIIPWRPAMTAGQIQKAFGTGEGEIGFSILRLRVPYNTSTSEFSVNVPVAQAAQSLGAIVFASPWTPPTALKSNNNIVGGTLKDSSYAAYAVHLKAFADYMAAQGVPLYGISIQNEPDITVTYESCDWNAAQMIRFLTENAPSVGTRIIAPESFQFRRVLSDSILNDSAAAANLDIVGGHIYGGGIGPYPLAVSKGKEVWMTEHLELDTTWTAVLATGREIHDCLEAGMNAYIWWYIVRYYGPVGEDGNVTKRGYVMSQYARFVRPGYYKIKCNPFPQRNVWVSAYKDGSSPSVVVVALNTGTTPVPQTFTVLNGGMTSVTPHTTSRYKNCVQGDDIAVKNGSFSVVLEASSITTFVSN